MLKNQRKTRIVLGVISLIIGWLLFTLPFLAEPTGSLYLVLLSFLLISVGFWLILSCANRKIAYSVMGLLDGISAPLFVYLSILIFNFNYVQMDFFIVSVILGIIGIIIGIAGIFIEIKSMKLKEIGSIFNFLFVLQIVLWVISMVLGMYSPCWTIS